MAPEIVPNVRVHSEKFRNKNLNLQWLRAAAAISVLVYHASSHLQFERGVGTFRAIFGDAFGLIGVAVFFAISGALMADIARKTNPYEFLIHRVLRIYPIFILVSAAVPIIFEGRLAFDSRALLLAPIGTSGNFRLHVEWTLVLEVFFYVMLFLAMIAGQTRNIPKLALGWIAVILIALPFTAENFQGAMTPHLISMPFFAANLAFAGGLLIPALARRGAFQPALAVIALGAGLACMAFPPGYDRAVGAFAAVILVGLAVMPQPIHVGDTLVEKTATRLGDFSYALYLCHVPIQLAIYTLDLPPPLLWALAIAVPLLVSVPLGLLDIRLYRFLRSKSDRSSPATFRRWALIYAGAYLLAALYFQFFES